MKLKPFNIEEWDWNKHDYKKGRSSLVRIYTRSGKRVKYLSYVRVSDITHEFEFDESRLIGVIDGWNMISMWNLDGRFLYGDSGTDLMMEVLNETTTI